MMMKPIARRAAARSAAATTVMAPIGGWNARDPLDNMPPQDAIRMDNFFPRERDVALREGYALHAETGQAARVGGLFDFSYGTTSKLIAFCNGKAFDATSDPPTELATGLNAGNEMFGFNFRRYLFTMNGANTIQRYDGTTWAASTFAKDAGEAQTFTSASIDCGMGFKRRIYFGGDGNLGFWYGTVDGVQGSVLYYFPLDGVFSKGGELVAMGAVTDDDGAGRNDFAVFISSKGQMAVYSGSNPGDANDWEIVGVYDVGEPLSRFGVQKFGADLVIITKDGYVPLSAILAGKTSQSRRYALSDKISGAATLAVDSFGANAGWRIVVYPKRSMLIFNVPRSASFVDQHVMNTVTRAWGRFTDILMTSLVVFGGELYFGSSDGNIYLYGDGMTTDVEDGISGKVECAWNYYGASARQKQFSQAQPIFASNAAPMIEVSFAVDYGPYDRTGSIAAQSAADIGIWDTSVWDVSIWAGLERAIKQWVGLRGLGFAGSMKIEVSETDASLAWRSTRIIYQPGTIR